MHTCLFYLGDLIVFSKTLGKHAAHVDGVRTAMRGAGVSLKLRNCQFFTEPIRYLGRIIRPGTLDVEEAGTASLEGLRHPKYTRSYALSWGCALCIVDSLRQRGRGPLYTLLKGDVQKSY